jgi:hypothetical protein
MQAGLLPLTNYGHAGAITVVKELWRAKGLMLGEKKTLVMILKKILKLL